MPSHDLRGIAWPHSPVDAAQHYYREIAPRLRAAQERAGPAEDGPEEHQALIVVFPPADEAHRAWRLAAIQSLAREAAPRRVVGIVGEEEAGVLALADWTANAPGITGQLLEVAGNAGGQS